MYHVISIAPAGAAYPDLYVSPADFRRQMHALSDKGWHAVTQRQVYDHWTKGTSLPSRPFVISFDDGLNGQVREALPVLKDLGWVGVLNLIVDHYQQQPASISKRNVTKLISAGWEIDSHTVHHLSLKGASQATLTEEITQSRRILIRDYHVPIDFFCYPAGRYDAKAVAAVRAAGYLAATTTDEGLAAPDSLYTLRRVRVHAHESPKQLIAAMD